MPAFGGDSLGDRPFCNWMPGGQKIPCDEVVQLGVVASEIVGRGLTRRYDGVVVGDLGVVEIPLGVG